LKIFLFLLLSSLSSVQAQSLAWNCGKLSLMWNEVPVSPGKEFQIDGCWQEKTYFIISSNCKKNLDSCLKLGAGNAIKHPGGLLGAPDFVACYRAGGRPRFLKVKINEKWEDTSSCFFKSEKSFVDAETMYNLQNKSNIKKK
jgi:hypothetical protein